MGESVSLGSSGCRLSSTEHARIALFAPPCATPIELAHRCGVEVRFARLPVPHVIVRPDVVLVGLDADPHEAALVAVARVLLDAHGKHWGSEDAWTIAALLRARCARAKRVSAVKEP